MVSSVMYWPVGRPIRHLFEQQGTDESDDGFVIRKDADDLRSSLDFAIETLDWVGRVQLCPMLFRECHVGEHILFSVVHDGGERWNYRSDLIGDTAPLSACCIRRILGKCRGDEGRDDPPATLSGMCQDVPHKVNPASLPCGAEQLGDGSLEALMGIGDDELHTAQTSAREPAQELAMCWLWDGPPFREHRV